MGLGRIQRLAVRLGVRLGSEQREAQRVAPHVERAEANADERAELRPQRLDVAHLVQVRADGGRAPGVLVLDQFVIGTAGGERGRDLFGREHGAAHRVVHALDARHVDKAGRAADQRAARETQPRHRLVAALGDRARAIGEPLATLEQSADRRMGLEALEFIERRQIRIVVIEMHDKADRDLVVIVMIEEWAAAGRIVQRPAERVLDQALLVFCGIDLPDFLQPDAEFRRLAFSWRSKFWMQGKEFLEWNTQTQFLPWEI